MSEPTRRDDSEIDGALERVRHPDAQYNADALTLASAVDQLRHDLVMARHATNVIAATRGKLSHSAFIVEEIALAIRARERKPEQIAADEADRGYHTALDGWRQVARDMLRNIDAKIVDAGSPNLEAEELNTGW